MFKIKEKIIDLGDGRTITLETGKMARQADGSVLIENGKDHVAGNSCLSTGGKGRYRFHATFS